MLHQAGGDSWCAGERGGKATFQRSISRLEKLTDGNLIKFKSGCICTPVGQLGVLQEDGGALSTPLTVEHFCRGRPGSPVGAEQAERLPPSLVYTCKRPWTIWHSQDHTGSPASFPWVPSEERYWQTGVAVFTQIHGTREKTMYPMI